MAGVRNTHCSQGVVVWDSRSGVFADQASTNRAEVASESVWRESLAFSYFFGQMDLR